MIKEMKLILSGAVVEAGTDVETTEVVGLEIIRMLEEGTDHLKVNTQVKVTRLFDVISVMVKTIMPGTALQKTN